MANLDTYYTWQEKQEAFSAALDLLSAEDRENVNRAISNIRNKVTFRSGRKAVSDAGALEIIAMIGIYFANRPHLIREQKNNEPA